MDAGSTVVTFGSTTDAFAFEDAAADFGRPGRLIPLPTAIAATCGLAWLLPPDAALPDLDSLRHEGVYRRADEGFVRLDA